VREVVEFERIGFLAYEQLSPGERVSRGRRELLEGTCSYHRAQIFPVRSVAEAQGKGG
jgi:hypothetical protein